MGNPQPDTSVIAPISSILYKCALCSHKGGETRVCSLRYKILDRSIFYYRSLALFVFGAAIFGFKAGAESFEDLLDHLNCLLPFLVALHGFTLMDEKDGDCQ